MAKAAAKQNSNRVNSEDFVASVERFANDGAFLEALDLLESSGFEAAQARLGEVVDFDPSDADLLKQLGGAALKIRDYNAAIAFFSRAVAAQPQVSSHYINLATASAVMGRVQEAVGYCREGLARADGNPKACLNVGTILMRLNQHGDAVSALRTAVELQPDFADAFCMLGLALMETGALDESEVALSKALELKPEFPEAQNNLGVLYMKLGKLDLAEAALRGAIESDPPKPESFSNLGDVLRLAGRLEESEAYCREALRLRADFPSAQLNLGNALREQGRFHEAETYYREALDSQPSYPEALNNLGSLMVDLGRVEEAVSLLHKATQIKPDYVDARVNLAMALLLAGRFREGWRTYEWRWKQPKNQGASIRFTKPRWEGEDIGKRVLLLHAEQGMGDTLQFCRYAPYLAAGHRVVLEVQPQLIDLLRRLPFVEQVVPQGAPLPPHDLQCPLLSLPRIFGTVVQTIPAGPYLDAEPTRVESWRKRLEPLNGLKVGLAWAGNPTLGSDRRRSISTSRLAALASIPGVEFVSLQKNLADSDAVPAELGLHDWTAELVDFHETAALVSALDLVVGVDTAVIHLAGALGRPVWLLNRFDRCWRWLLGREDSPWYPTMKQFIQSTPGDWDEVLERVRVALLELRDARRSASQAADQPA